MPPTVKIDKEAAIDRLMRYIAVEGTTGDEAEIAAAVREDLLAIGLSERQVKHDKAHERIPEPTPVGNLIAHLPGTRKGPHLVFSTHMDTVPLCKGAKPVRKGRRIVPEGETALGGDDRTGVGVLVTLAAELKAQKLKHPPITLLFTVREESGLYGARFLDPDDLKPAGKVGKPVMGFNVDGKAAATFCVGATGAQRWAAEIRGKAAHAGVAPERGISATAVASLALTEVYRAGYFSKVEMNGHAGTSNVGSFGGPDMLSAGNASNTVTDYVKVTGECRSHDPAFCKQITEAYKQAFQKAALEVTDHDGKPAKVKFTARLDYHPFRLKDDEPCVARATRALKEALGKEPELIAANGGLDANWIVKHGLPTVTFGAGQNEIHTTKEYVDLTEYEAGCRLALAIAALEDDA